MKIIHRLLAIILLGIPSFAHAQLILFGTPSTDCDPVTFTFTLANSGPVYLTGTLTDQNSTAVTVNGTAVLSFFDLGPTNFQSYPLPYTPASSSSSETTWPPGTYTVSVYGDTATTQNPPWIDNAVAPLPVMLIAPNEQPAGVQNAIDTLTSDITTVQTAETQDASNITSFQSTLSSLQSQLTTIQNTLQSEIGTLQANEATDASNISAFQASSSNQVAQIAALQTAEAQDAGNITALQTQLQAIETTLQNEITQDEANIAALQTGQSNQTGQITTLQQQVAQLQVEQQGLEATLASLPNSSGNSEYTSLQNQINGLKSANKNQWIALGGVGLLGAAGTALGAYDLSLTGDTGSSGGAGSTGAAPAPTYSQTYSSYNPYSATPSSPYSKK